MTITRRLSDSTTEVLQESRMREIRTSGSTRGKGTATLPYSTAPRIKE